MTTAIRTSAIVVLIVGSGLVLVLAREQQAAGSKRTDRATTSTAGSTRGASPRETITVVANEPIPNLPGKRVVSRVIDYPPGGGSTPHRHARSAFIYAYVLSGLIRSQVDDEPARVYRPGETWFESPGTTKIDGVDIHFIHVRSRQANALPLIMTHGWPGSVIELLDTVGPLTEPTRYGGTPNDAFHLVLPSLPGYGFSGEPADLGWESGRIAQVWAKLMERLGDNRYVALRRRSPRWDVLSQPARDASAA